MTHINKSHSQGQSCFVLRSLVKEAMHAGSGPEMKRNNSLASIAYIDLNETAGFSCIADFSRSCRFASDDLQQILNVAKARLLDTWPGFQCGFFCFLGEYSCLP